MEIDWKKKYNEALEKIKRYTIDEYGCTRLKPTDIFPELAESEDERIRERLVEYFAGFKMGNAEVKWEGLVVQEILAWLEKQKEPTEELSTRLNGLMQEYVKSGKDEEEQEHRLKCYHLFWDALSDSEFFKQKEQKSLLPEDKVKHSLYVEGFEAGKEVGRQYEKVFRKQKEDKSEWSDEDEEIFNLTIIHLLSYAYPDNPIYCEEAEKCVAWLKSLKNRGNSPKSNTNSPSWSEEDENRFNNLCRIIREAEGWNEVSKNAFIDWLKSLRPKQTHKWRRYIWAVNLRFTYAGLVRYEDNGSYEIVTAGGKPKRQVNGEYILLKDISSTGWKPSEEQMRQLGYVAEQNKHNMLGKELMTLYNDLKKLM